MNTRAISYWVISLMIISQTRLVISQTTIPKPDHIVIAIMENHSFEQLMDSSAAPYIHSLTNDTLSALFTDSHAEMHPSQPNYIILFSGSAQGVKNDSMPKNTPFTTPNLGRQLIDSGKTFVTYSEGLPEVGYNGVYTNQYARKHNPVTNWMGTGTNQVPLTTNQPFTAFPSGDYSFLPTVCYVVPNLKHDMHNGTDPERITTGDQWLKDSLDGYIQWAKNNNSLFILSLDEDNYTPDNHIITIFTGQMVLSGQYSTKINHFSVLHTIEEMYGLPFIGDSLIYAPITYCWKENPSTSISTEKISDAKIYPNPTHGSLYIELSDDQEAIAEIYNVNGQLMQVNPLESSITTINTDGLMRGFYILKITSKKEVILRKIIKN
jgi:phosphatidylinositol-3-phosphatase